MAAARFGKCGSPTVSIQAYPVAVETGRANGDRLELLRGDLRAGDRLVLLGNERLRPASALHRRKQSATYV